MNINHQEEALHTAMTQKLSALMEEARMDIFRKKPGLNLYNGDAHHYLVEQAWELMFPLPPEEWERRLLKLIIEPAMPWPMATTYAYAMNVIHSPRVHVGNLRFGYAVKDGKLLRCAFFAVEVLVDDMPQAQVIDPLGVAHGASPEFYIGCRVEEEDVANFLLKREDPLESFVRRHQDDPR